MNEENNLPTDSELTEFVLGELSSERSAEIRTQIEQDSALAATVAERRATVALIRDSFAAEAELELTDQQRLSVASAVASAKTPVSIVDRSLVGRRSGLAWLLAASLVGLLVGGYYWSSDRSDKRPIALSSIKTSDETSQEMSQEMNRESLDVGAETDRLLADERVARDWQLPELKSELGENLASAAEIDKEVAAVELMKNSAELQIRSDDFASLQKMIDSETGQSSGKNRGEIQAYPANLSLIVRQEQSVVENQPQNNLGYDSVDSADLGIATFSFDGSQTSDRSSNSLLTELYERPDPQDRVSGLARQNREMAAIELKYLGTNGRRSDSERMLNENLADLDGRKSERGSNVPQVDGWFDFVTGKPTDGKEANTSEPLSKERPSLLSVPVPEKKEAAKTWKRSKSSPNATRLLIGDDDELDLNGMQVNVQIDGFRARVLIDCFYYNDRDQQLEGNFKLRLPDDASLYYFAFGESAYEYEPQLDWAKREFAADNAQFVSLQPDRVRAQRDDQWKNCKEARMVPREKAAYAYQQTIQRKVDPALVEWSGAGVFNARVFPLAPKTMHRIVMGYDVNLAAVEDGWKYQFELPERVGECRVDVHVSRLESKQIAVQPADASAEAIEVKRIHLGDATVQADDELSQGVRYRWTNPTSAAIQVRMQQFENVLLANSDPDQGEFWGLQITPELPADPVAGNSHAIFMLDTSLSSNPDKFNVWLKLLQTTLDGNRDSLKRFNVLFFDVSSSFWKAGFMENTPENVAELMRDCDRLALEGATDLYGAVTAIVDADWVREAKVSGPDLFLLSDGAANWGESNLRLIEAKLREKKLGRLYAYQTGVTGTAIGNLRFLAHQSGGTVFSVATEAEIKTAATAHRNRPWQLVSIKADGASDVLTAGRVEWIYPGQSLTVVGRGSPLGDVVLNLQRGDENKTVSIQTKKVASELAARMYGTIAVGQLESLGGSVQDVATAYARHFRVTGETCSLLMLESEADYERFGIKPEEDWFVIQSKNAGRLVDEALQQFAAELMDPKAQLLGWLNRLTAMPGMEFELPTALKVVLDDLSVVAISQPLKCDPFVDAAAGEEYLLELKKEELNYDIVAAESERRSKKSVDEAIKVLSCLVERNPGDWVIARDVAFSAIELDRPAQAYPLLLKLAQARPYEASVYPAIGQCLAQLKQADMAIVFFEIALAARFENRGDDYRKIVAADYLHVLRQIKRGELTTSVPEFAAARQQTLAQILGFESADLLVTMMWNTDQTDVDLHIREPSGEECSYENKTTRSGGQITEDITTGFGPEMYRLLDAAAGKYEVAVKLFANNQSRVGLRNKVHLTIYRRFGKSDEQVRRETIVLKTVGEQELVVELKVGK